MHHPHSDVTTTLSHSIFNLNKKQSTLNITLFTPLSLEQDAVRPFLQGAVDQTDGGITYLTGHFEGLHQSYHVTVVETGPRNSAVALAAERAVLAFRPSIAILLGIAGGVKDVAIGDVVVGTKAYSYESGKDTASGFVYRPEVYLSSRPLIALARLVAKNDAWKKRSTYAKGKKTTFGPIASGDKVIATTDSDNYRHIKLHLNDTVALEMEAAGFGQTLSNHPYIHTINIRSISDLLDHKSEGDGRGLQQHAAANAAAFTFELLYQLDPKQLNLPIMTTKELVKTIYENIAPAIQSEMNGLPSQGGLWEKLKPLLSNELQELKADPSDEDAQAAIRIKLKRALNENETLKKDLENMLEKVNAGGTEDNSVHIENSKNVIQGSNISIGGNAHIGDKTEIGKKYEVKEVGGNVYIAETINIEQASSTHGLPLKSPELNTLKSEVMKNNIKPAIKMLLAHSSHDQDLNNQIILLASRWNQLQREKNMNIISKSQANIEYNRIRAALLDTIDEMEGAF